MTRQNAKDLLPIIEAYANGKDIQCYDGGEWLDIGVPSFASSTARYRIKSKPELVPLTAKDMGLLKNRWIRPKNGENIFAIVGLNESSGVLKIGNNWISLESLFRNYEFEDGSPCGKYVE